MPTLREVIEQGLLMGLGVVSLTRETAQHLVDEMVKKGQAQREEAEEMIDRLVKRGEREREALRKLIREELEAVLKELNLPTRAEIQALETKLDALLHKLETRSEG